MSESRDLSPELKAAQELLYLKRAEARAERIRLGLPVDVARERKGQEKEEKEGLTAESAKDAEAKKGKEGEEREEEKKEITVAELIQQLPAHLGWGSAAYSQLVRRSGKDGLTAESAKSAEQKKEEVAPQLPTTTILFALAEEPAATSLPTPTPSIKIFAHVLDVLHRRGLDGPGRVWLLLRHMDTKGEGRISQAAARQALAEEGGSLKCVSWKRLRQLLAEGEGLLWARDPGREWIYTFSEARVARNLGLGVIRGWAVKIPITQLLGSIQEIRALFHDAFHSGRGDGFQEPITRRVMESRGAGDGRTQRQYELQRGIVKRANFASLGRYSHAKWQQAQGDSREYGRVGGPAFTYIDYKGVLGQNPRKQYRAEHQQHWENIYIMRQVGNSYSGSLPTTKRGRKWTNYKLKHLCQSMPSTGTFEGEETSNGRFYYRDEESATQALLKGDKPISYSQHPTAGPSGYWEEQNHIRVAKEANQPF